MKKSITLIILLMSMAVATAQTKTINLQTNGTQIKNISTSCAFKVGVRQGSTSSAIMTVSDRFVDDVIFTLDSSGELKIGMKNGVNLKGGEVLNVEVVCPSINEIDASSASQVRINSAFSVNTLDIDVSSAAQVICNENITVSGKCEIDASSAARVELKGSTNQLDIDASSAARILCFDFAAQTADVEASSAARIEVKASKSVKAEASSAASIEYDCPSNGVRVDSDRSSSIKKR